MSPFAVAEPRDCGYNESVLLYRQEGRYHQLATRYPSDYDNRGRVEPGISRGSRSGGASRPGASRSGYASQRSGYGAQRPPQRSASGQRPRSSGQRPPQRSGQGPNRRPPQSRGGYGRRRGPNRMPMFAALAVLIRRILKAHRLDIPGTVYYDEALDHLSSFYNEDPEHRAYYVLVEEGEPAGGIGLAELPFFENCCELQKLYLSESLQGRGIGYQMISLIEEQARLRGYQRIRRVK